jgi:hypothetical protein
MSPNMAVEHKLQAYLKTKYEASKNPASKKVVYITENKSFHALNRTQLPSYGTVICITRLMHSRRHTEEFVINY